MDSRENSVPFLEPRLPLSVSAIDLSIEIGYRFVLHISSSIFSSSVLVENCNRDKLTTL